MSQAVLDHFYLTLALGVFAGAILVTGGVPLGWRWAPRLSAWFEGHPLYIRIGAVGLLVTIAMIDFDLPKLAVRIALLVSLGIITASILLKRWL